MRLKVALLALPTLLVLAACSRTGHLKVPFTRDAPFIPTAVPADFEIHIDENHDTFYSRQHIAQVVKASDAMSKTTYTTFRDYNNSVSNKFSQETPLSPEQLQAMWNEVSSHNLLDRSIIWANWFSGADLYKRDAYTLQIRANGRSRVYRLTNGFSGQQRPLVLLVEAVRLPLSQQSGTRVIPGPAQEPAPASQPAPEQQPEQPTPATLPLEPQTQPATMPEVPPME
jgi:hypothetical protein